MTQKICKDIFLKLLSPSFEKEICSVLQTSYQKRAKAQKIDNDIFKLNKSFKEILALKERLKNSFNLNSAVDVGE